MTTTTAELPPTMWQYSVKLETTKSYVNITAQAHGTTARIALVEAIDLLETARRQLHAKGMQAAPLEFEEKA